MTGLLLRGVSKPAQIHVEREAIDARVGAITAHMHMAFRGDYYGLGAFVIVDRISDHWKHYYLWRDIGRGAIIKRIESLGGRLPYIRPALDGDY